MVVPSEKILAVLNHPDFVAVRDAKGEKFDKARMPTMD